MKAVIVGAGLAGHTAALELRRLSAEASITLIGAESGLPYDRPPLSKELLLGTREVDAITLPDAADYQALRIDYRPGVSVTQIDRSAHRVLCATGDGFDYDALLLATGSRPRRLPALLASPRLIYVRTRDDALALRDRLRPGIRLAVVGGGFIGLEIAAAARGMGCSVVVVESQPRLLSRGLPPLVGDALATLHRANGVEILCDRTLTAIRDGDAEGMVLVTNDETIEADVVVVGIGVEPNVELAAAAGLETENGIVVDHACRTSDLAIFAAGEVTAHPSRNGVRRRLESWKVAAEQPLVAASAMLGLPASYTAIPWLWSDQFGHNLQFIGSVEGARWLVLQGSIDTPNWTLVALDDAQQPIGGAAMNNGRHISMLRSAMTKGTQLPESILAGGRMLPSAA